MKRIALLFLVASFLTVSASSVLSASPPVAGDSTTSVSARLSHYLLIIVRAFGGQETDLSAGDCVLPLIGGDADDLADGRTDPEDEGFDSPIFDFGPSSKTSSF